MCKITLDLLEVCYLRLGEIVIKRITVIKFGVGSGGGYFGIKVRIDAAKLTNMIIAGFGGCTSKMATYQIGENQNGHRIKWPQNNTKTATFTSVSYTHLTLPTIYSV